MQHKNVLSMPVELMSARVVLQFSVVLIRRISHAKQMAQPRVSVSCIASVSRLGVPR